jgi:hypothetical protein
MLVPMIPCAAYAWELQKRSDDLERITGVHVSVTPFNVDGMLELLRRLLAEAGRARDSRGMGIPDVAGRVRILGTPPRGQ